MKIDRLLNEFEFELKDFSQYQHSRLNLKSPVFIKILDLRLNQTNYDGFISGEISSLSVVFVDASKETFHLNYKPGIIKGLEKLDSLVVEYNSSEDKKAVFQKMKLFGENRNFSVRNQYKFTYPSKTSKTDLFKKNYLILKSFLENKKLNKKLEFEDVVNESFQVMVVLKNKVKVFIRVSSFINPGGTFDHIFPFLAKDVSKLTNKYGQNKSYFFFLQPEILAKYSGKSFGNIKSLEKFLQEKENLK